MARDIMNANGYALQALDYAVAQHILPLINGNDDSYRRRLDNLGGAIDQLTRSKRILREIISTGEREHKFALFFSLMPMSYPVTLLLRRERESEQVDTPLDLFTSLDHIATTPRVLEDEVISFVLRSPKQLSDVQLWIQDMEVEDVLEEVDALHRYYSYWWQPNDQKNPRLFLNHFGQSTITIIFSDPAQSGEMTLYAVIEVLARKINKERAEQMLTFLETRLEDVTRHCFSLTHKTAASKCATTVPASVLLQEVKKQLSQFRSNLPRFRQRKRCRLLPKPFLTDPTTTNALTAHSVTWLLSHLDALIPSATPTSASIYLNSRLFDLQQIEAEILHEDTDVYENQIIHGYVENVASTLSGLTHYYQKTLQSLNIQRYSEPIPGDYGSFDELRNRYGRKYYAKLITICEQLQQECQFCIQFIEKHLPVRRSITEMPEMTPAFLAHAHYREIFELIVDWYRLGRPNVSGDQFLYGLRTLDKLYELFCLFRTIEALSVCGWIQHQPDEETQIERFELEDWRVLHQ